MIGIALGASGPSEAVENPNLPPAFAAPVFAGSVLIDVGRVVTPAPTAPVFADAILTEE